MMGLLFSLLLFLYSQKIKMILSVCAALITVDDSSCYFIVNIFRRGSSKLVLSYVAGSLVCCSVLPTYVADMLLSVANVYTYVYTKFEKFGIFSKYLVYKFLIWYI